LDAFKEIIESLSIPERDKELLLKELKAVQKNAVVLEFKFKRTMADKTAITNILNASIEEVEKQKKIIENAKDEINHTLTEVDHQKKLIEDKNTELNKLLVDLREAQQQLVMAEKMASLGQLTAGVAHEINNPINFVSANIKPLKEDLADIVECINRYESVIQENKLEDLFSGVQQFKNKTDIAFSMKEIQDLLRGIEEGANRTSEIVKGLRNFSRLDQNVIKKANLNEGIESTLTLLHSTYKDKVEIQKDYGDIQEVECLPGQINQVLMNILSNAIQAISEKGEIFIKTRQEESTVTISIRDTGSGMSEETKQKIFDPFFTTKEVGKGTGLGLSISYGIIEKHQGKIEVNSVQGKGTEFIITLPVHQNKNNKITT
jgi:two-component system, NtrC family, sensor kinase